MQKLSKLFSVFLVTIFLVSTGVGSNWFDRFDQGVNKYLGSAEASEEDNSDYSDEESSSDEPSSEENSEKEEIVPIKRPAKRPAPKKPLKPALKKPGKAIPVTTSHKVVKKVTLPTASKPATKKASKPASVKVSATPVSTGGRVWATPKEKPTPTASPRVVRKPSPPKPRRKTPEPTAPSEDDDNAIEQLPMLLQPNGWECGYYSVFHYLATRNDYPVDELEDLYEEFIDDITEDEEIAALYDAEEYTSGVELTGLIALFGDPEEVLVIDERQLDGIIPTTEDVVRKINTLRERQETFWVIVCSKNPLHWVCLMFPAGGGCMCIDSLSSARAANAQPVLVNVKNLCFGIVPLPTADQFHGTSSAYLTVLENQPEVTPARTAFLATLRADALAHGFTPEVFDALAKHRLKKCNLPVVKPSRSKKAESAEPIIVDDEGDKEKSPAKRTSRRAKK